MQRLRLSIAFTVMGWPCNKVSETGTVGSSLTSNKHGGALRAPVLSQRFQIRGTRTWTAEAVWRTVEWTGGDSRNADQAARERLEVE